MPAQIEQLATGFGFTEGPLWRPEGCLLFSDIPNNTIFQWTPGGQVSEYRKPSGFDGTDAPAGALVGSNGLSADAQGRLTICEHGNARVTRIEADGSVTVLASRYEGKRLNSPNDLVYHSSGALYFTDPPYGLPGQDSDPAKELPFNGVFRCQDGKLLLLAKELNRPNGLAFSPDETVLYVSNSERERKVWMRFEVRTDGGLGEGSVLLDATHEAGEGSPDGMKIDVMGNLYCTGPGGVWVITAQGKPLGVIHIPEVPANLHWGDEDGQTLYITARASIYRIKLSVPGIRP